MTSNAGASTIKKQKSIGFAQSKDEVRNEYEKMKESVMVFHYYWVTLMIQNHKH